jgi:hypothetical protein
MRTLWVKSSEESIDETSSVVVPLIQVSAKERNREVRKKLFTCLPLILAARRVAVQQVCSLVQEGFKEAPCLTIGSRPLPTSVSADGLIVRRRQALALPQAAFLSCWPHTSFERTSIFQ